MHPLALAKHLDRSRFEFAVCVIENASASNVEELTRTDCHLYTLNLSRRFYNLIQLLRVMHRVYQLCSRLKPDIVQTHGLRANLLGRPAAKWAGVRVIISTETALPEMERNVVRRVLNAPLHGLNRLLDRGTQQIVVVSDSVRRWKDPGGRSRKVQVIAPPFRLEAFSAADAQRRAAVVEGEGPLLGVVGRLSPEKGHRFLIAAMPEILAVAPDARLLIAGSGRLEARLRTQVDALGLGERVRFLGYVSDVQSVFARLDVLIVPSLADSCPLVTLEGMMMALPVVGSRTGGIAEMILHGETGLLVPPGDSGAIAHACRYLLRNPEVGREMGKRGRKRVLSEFHPSKFIARHETLYLDAVGGVLQGRSCGAS